MAVEIKYVVVRKGEEKMTFASKKEADAYDKMLDMAEAFSDWLIASPLAIEEPQREALGMFLAENKDAVQHILRTSKAPETESAAGTEAGDAAEESTTDESASDVSAIDVSAIDVSATDESATDESDGQRSAISQQQQIADAKAADAQDEQGQAEQATKPVKARSSSRGTKAA